ncbi:hypothetical protein [Mycolicibacterium sp. P1-18]|uniref:hypothetical protein n=1 Tax=Mycolicibacterium sp. P1-18 TaxID=2024615 RepID=UPI0015679C3A|nr:hypothetical protein [Mycolicibacterium sp. P1-18]
MLIEEEGQIVERRPRSGAQVGVSDDAVSPAPSSGFLVFGADGSVRETTEPVWDEARVKRALRPQLRGG